MTALKAEELRIGNYFMFGAMRHRCSYHDIANLCKAEAKGQVIELYQPIPITEEWLLKLGFVKISGTDNLYGVRKISNGLFIVALEEHDGNKEVKLWINSGTFAHPVKFLHELQNLYYSITHTELTIIESHSLTVETKKG